MENGLIVVFDDEVKHIERIKKELKKYFGEEKIYAFTKIDKKFLNENIIDLAIFDIEFDYGVDGLEFVIELRKEQGFDLEVIFISSHEERTQEAQKVGPAYFVYKGNLEADLKEAISSLELRGFRKKKILETSQGFIKTGHVMYIESDNNNIAIYTTNGEPIRERGKLEEKLKDLKKYGFIRCHKSYLINLEYFVNRDKTTVFLEKGITLPIGRKYDKEFDIELRKFIINKYIVNK